MATQCEELTHLKRPWCWEWLKAGGEGDDRGWDGWMASPTQWTWIWISSGSWWWTGKPGVLQFMGLQRVRHDWATELKWTEGRIGFFPLVFSSNFSDLKNKEKGEISIFIGYRISYILSTAYFFLKVLIYLFCCSFYFFTCNVKHFTHALSFSVSLFNFFLFL